MTSIGQNLKAIRLKLGITQEELAKVSGVNYNTIIKIESNKTKKPTPEVLTKLASACNVDINEMIDTNKRLTQKPVVYGEERLAFDKLKDEDFERLCFEIVRGEYPKLSLERWGGSGDGGKDLRVINDDKVFYYQCKGGKTPPSLSDYKVEIDKIKNDSKKYIKRGLLLGGISFYISTSISPTRKNQVEDYVFNELGLKHVEFQTEFELNSKVRRDKKLQDNHFSIKNLAKIENVINKIDKNTSSHSQILERIDKSFELDSNRLLLKSSNLIHNGLYEEAKVELLKNLDKAKNQGDKKIIAKILHNIGICYGLLGDGNEIEESIRYFKEALEYDNSLLNPKINILYSELKGDKQAQTNALTEINQLWRNISNYKSNEQSYITNIYLSAIYTSSGCDSLLSKLKGKKSKLKKYITNNIDAKFFIAQIYLEKEMTEKAFIVIEEILQINYSPDILLLKAKALMQKVQLEELDNPNAILPRVKETAQYLGEVEKTAEEILKLKDIQKKHNIFEQTKLILSIILLWKRDTKTLNKLTKQPIRQEFIDEHDKRTLLAARIGQNLLSRDYKKAYQTIEELEDWKSIPIGNKFELLSLFIEYGSVNEAQKILNRLKIEYKNESPILLELAFTETVISILLNDKVGSINSALSAIELAKKARPDDKELVSRAISNYGAVAERYASENEGDRLFDSMNKLQELNPDKKILWPIQALDASRNITAEFSNILEEQKNWYQNLRETFLSYPVPFYMLSSKRFLNRNLIRIISAQNDPEFRIQFNDPTDESKKLSLLYYEESDQIILDYLILLDLSKSNLLRELYNIDKKFIVTRSLFKKIQDDLLEFESIDLRNVWEFLKSNDVIEISDQNNTINNKNISKIFKNEQWLIDTIGLAKEKNSLFLTNDLRLSILLKNEKIKTSNIFSLIDELTQKNRIDEKIYASILGKLAERIYTFISYTANDLFYIVSEDDYKITLRSYHLVNEMLISGAHVDSFMNVFNAFIFRLMNSGILIEDQYKWIELVNDKYFEVLKFRIGESSVQPNTVREASLKDIELSIQIYTNMWTQIILNAELELLKKLEVYINNHNSEFMKESSKHYLKLIDKVKKEKYGI